MGERYVRFRALINRKRVNFMESSREQVLDSLIILFRELGIDKEEATNLAMAISVTKTEFKILKALEDRYEGNSDIPTKEEIREIVARIA